MLELRFPRRWLSALMFAALWACSISDDDPDKPRAERFCESMCIRANACDRAIDVSYCLNYCVMNPGGIPSLRDDVVDLVSDCMQSTGCAVILGDEPTAQCFEEAETKIAPSAGAVAYCKAIAEPEFECGYEYQPSECAENVKLWDDAFLASIQHCASETTCDEHDACFERAWSFE